MVCFSGIMFGLMCLTLVLGFDWFALVSAACFGVCLYLDVQNWLRRPRFRSYDPENVIVTFNGIEIKSFADDSFVEPETSHHDGRGPWEIV